MNDPLTIRLMREDEVGTLIAWATAEGWNPGLHDAELFWSTDPQAFIAAEVKGELIGGGAVISYDGEYGFMGLFVVRPEWRGRGVGRRLWQARLRLLQSRLRPGASIGMDGVFAMQDWYAKGGFVFSHRSIRFEGVGASVDPVSAVEPVAAVPFEAVLAYDRRCFPVGREAFLRRWVAQPDSVALAARDGDRVRGYGVIRRCGRGAKIGPLFADDAGVAEALFLSLAGSVPDEPVFIDVPEVNAWAMSLALRHDMREVFGCARMYLGAAPTLDISRVYGSTTFELG